MAQKIEAKDERPLQTFWLKDFLAVDTSDSRIAPPNNSTFYDLLNAQPIGFSNIHSVADISAMLHDYTDEAVYRMWDVNLLNKEYILAATKGKELWAYDVADQTAALLGVLADDYSAQVAQFDYSTVLIVDKGTYAFWPAQQTGDPMNSGMANIGTISGNAPTWGDAIAVYQNITWIAQGRMLYYSVAGAATDTPPAYANFDTTAGAGVSVLADSTLRSDVTALYVANGYLYIFGETSIDAISQVTVIPPTTTGGATSLNFTRLNITANVGTDQPQSILTYRRFLMFANRWGIWLLYGTTVQQVSSFDANNNYLSAIDGTYQYLNFAHAVAGQQWVNNANQTVGWVNNNGMQVAWGFGAPYAPWNLEISGGVLLSNRQLCAAWLVNRTGDPVFPDGNFQLMYQDDAAGHKWWSSQFNAAGDVTCIVPSVVNNEPALFGIINNRLYQLFDVETSSPPARIMTPLWDFGDPVAMKQALRAGVRMTLFSPDPSEAQVNVYLETLRSSYLLDIGVIGPMQWVNEQGQTVTWAPNPGNPDEDTDWVSQAPYVNFNGKAPQCYSPYLGFRVVTGQGTVFELDQLTLDYKIGPRWVGE